MQLQNKLRKNCPTTVNGIWVGSTTQNYQLMSIIVIFTVLFPEGESIHLMFLSIIVTEDLNTEIHIILWQITFPWFFLYRLITAWFWSYTMRVGRLFYLWFLFWGIIKMYFKRVCSLPKNSLEFTFMYLIQSLGKWNLLYLCLDLLLIWLSHGLCLSSNTLLFLLRLLTFPFPWAY